jgi:hypothetical protein
MAPLNVPQVGDTADSVKTLRAALVHEAQQAPQASPEAYGTALQLCDAMVNGLSERAHFLAANPGGLDATRVQAWGQRANLFQTTLAVLASRLQREVETSPRPYFSPVPLISVAMPAVGAPIRTPPPAVKPPPPAGEPGEGGDSVRGEGPTGGTNFGIGGRTLKMHGVVSSSGQVAHRASIDCYWICWNGRQHVLSLAAGGHRDGNVSVNSSIECFIDDKDWKRTHRATDGILRQGAGVYRGWLVCAHDSHGRLIGALANIPEFTHLVH